jgi:hypothetical protein
VNEILHTSEGDRSRFISDVEENFNDHDSAIKHLLKISRESPPSEIPGNDTLVPSVRAVIDVRRRGGVDIDYKILHTNKKMTHQYVCSTVV